jgi:hypothetical protein
MARLQILELPEGPDDERPPFVLVIDQAEDSIGRSLRRHVGVPEEAELTTNVAHLIGARGVLVFAETIEIPANDVSVEFREGMQQHLGEMYESARRSLSESETLGHKLLQRAEQAEAVTAHTKGLMERRTRTLRERAEQAEAGRVAADNVLRAVCEVFGGPHQDPVVKARETLARARQAEDKMQALVEAQQSGLVERMDAITDALGFDRLRDWDKIVSAIRAQRAGGHLFEEPGFRDPDRCALCRLGRRDWLVGHDRRTCAEVRAQNGGE